MHPCNGRPGAATRHRALPVNKVPLVLQSHRTPLPWPWLQRCMASVRDWSDVHGYDYRFLGDELFDHLPPDLRDRTREQPVVASDLARLRLLQHELANGRETVIWMDADVLVFAPNAFTLPATGSAVGREVWVQRDGRGRLKVYRKVHNAFLMFRADNSLLAFYAETAQRLLRLNPGKVSPQFIGPKLLTALHNIARFPVQESAGMLSPLVIKDCLNGTGDALARFLRNSPQTVTAANLCASSCVRGEIASSEMETLISRLLQQRAIGA